MKNQKYDFGMHVYIGSPKYTSRNFPQNSTVTAEKLFLNRTKRDGNLGCSQKKRGLSEIREGPKCCNMCGGDGRQRKKGDIVVCSHFRGVLDVLDF